MARHTDLQGAKILPFRRKNYKPVRDYIIYTVLFLAFLQIGCLIYLITTKL
jgi:hypothetical protein